MCRKNADEPLEDAIANQRDVDPKVKQRGAFLGWCVAREKSEGVVARNHEAEVIFCATRRVRAFWLPEIAECKALVMALRLGRRYGCANIIIEMDCKLLNHSPVEIAQYVYMDIFNL
ncbi:hypothetical protein POM88_035781 [Heracleum sosnowskyi]|uniref:RNase H type-1 domain-containing protein n=1 Tax=Heracleum sosnowskyi TaxID=360622 RepID=A0AAD8HNM0_9APIA|nr:hypothetical protein POM88_035781 [Heracleum sosnowskyi]